MSSKYSLAGQQAGSPFRDRFQTYRQTFRIEPDPEEAKRIVKNIIKGREIRNNLINLNAPDIAENGNTVPIGVESKKAAAIKILALGNPGPDVITFKFGPLSATRSASTRIRLRKTQEVLAIAKLEDGSFIQDIKTVKVTIGGCGG